VGIRPAGWLRQKHELRGGKQAVCTAHAQGWRHLPPGDMLPDGEQTQVLFAYADDLLLASTKPTEHTDALGRICDAVDQVKLTIHPQKCQTLVCSSEEASAEAAMQEAEAALLARGSPLAPLRTATRFRYLGHTFAAQGLLPGDEDLARSASLLAHTVRGSSKVARLRPRQIVRLCKTLVLSRLDWGLAVPTDPGESGALWEEQDRQSDEILAKAVVLPIFGLMTTKRRKLPDEIILMELGIKPAWERRRNLARGLIVVLGSLGRLHPTEASMRTSNGAQAQVLQWLHLRAQDRAAYHNKRPHPFMRARQATLAGGGVDAPAYDLLRTGITRASNSARQQLRRRVCCIVASLIHRLMANTRPQITPPGAGDT